MSPVQVAGYCEMWTRLRATAPVAHDINALIEQKIALGLLPPTAPRVRNDFSIKPIVFASEPKTKSSAWVTFDVVLGHVTAHHPNLLKDLVVYSLTRTKSALDCRPRG